MRPNSLPSLGEEGLLINERASDREAGRSREQESKKGLLPELVVETSRPDNEQHIHDYDNAISDSTRRLRRPPRLSLSLCS